MSDFTDWTQDELAERPSTTAIEAAGSLLVKANNTFSKDYEALAQGTTGQLLRSQGSNLLPLFVDNDTIKWLVNGEGFEIFKCQPVYIFDNGTVKLAEAGAIATARVIGLVDTTGISSAGTGPIAVNGIITATTSQWDALIIGIGGLAAGTIYYLEPASAGKLTITAPTTATQLVTRIGMAISTTELVLNIQPTILL